MVFAVASSAISAPSGTDQGGSTPGCSQDLDGTGLWAGIVLVPEMFRPERAGRGYLSSAIAQGGTSGSGSSGGAQFQSATLVQWGAVAGAERLSHAADRLAYPEYSWDEIRNICPGLSGSHRNRRGHAEKILYYSRIYYPLLDTCPNLRLELHDLCAYLGLEESGGAVRLLPADLRFLHARLRS